MEEAQRRREGLITPTLQDHAPPRTGASPWALGSQVYVAFFGGALAVTAIALVNARRLGLPKKSRVAIGATGAAAFVASIVVAAFVFNGGDAETPRGLRVAVQLVGIAGWGIQYLIQRPWDRLFQTFDEREYDSLLGPGLLAVLSVGLVQLGLVMAVTS